MINWRLSSCLSSHRPSFHVNPDVLEITVVYQNAEQQVQIHKERCGSDLYNWARENFNQKNFSLFYGGLRLKEEESLAAAGLNGLARVFAVAA